MKRPPPAFAQDTYGRELIRKKDSELYCLYREPYTGIGCGYDLIGFRLRKLLIVLVLRHRINRLNRWLKNNYDT